MITVEHLSLAIAAIVCIVGLCTFVYNRIHDHGKREHWQGQVSAKLDHIGEDVKGLSGDVKDLKAQQRTFERQIIETREIALNAKNTADKAHERLDKINAPSSYGNNNRQEQVPL